MPTMDFEAYLPSNDSQSEQARVLDVILDNETAAGIDYVVIMPAPTERPDNHAMHEVIRDQPRVLGCCQVNPNYGDESVRELETAITQWNMGMLKIMPSLYNCPLDSPLIYALMDVAQQHGIIVNVHSGDHHCHPLEIGALARRYPDVSIIMDHMGYRYQCGAANLAAQDNPNIFLGTTIAAFEPSVIERAIEATGPDRIIFGSNMPVAYADLAAESIRRHGFGSEAETMILGGNLARLYGMS